VLPLYNPTLRLPSLDSAHLAPAGTLFGGSSESPSSNAVTSVYSAGTTWLTGAPGSECGIAGGDMSATLSAAPLSSESGGGKRAAAFAGERCVGDRPGDGVAAHARRNGDQRHSGEVRT